MRTSSEIKNDVVIKYGEIAEQKTGSDGSCCGVLCCGDDNQSLMAEDYTKLDGYNPDADLGLGCGLPTQFAKIKKGDVVIDLGSGAGNDCFIARREAGENGKVIGIDMTPTMIDRARKNAEKLGYNNIEFRYGDIEEIPVSSDYADVIVSNCVLNLVPDKKKVFNEIFRVLKPGGHFSISDIVLSGSLPSKITEVAEMYAGCISGAIHQTDYIDAIKSAGFTNIEIQKRKVISLPDELLLKYLTMDELSEYKNSGAGIFSITVYAEKNNETCCDKTTCCK